MNILRVICLSFFAVFIAAGSIAADEFSCPFPTVTRCKDNSYEFSYAQDNPEEVQRNKSFTIRVIGGRPPYSWSVSGQGFSIDGPAQANEPVISIIADSTACGSADILIKDQCREISGSVRCSDAGNWVEIKPTECRIGGAPTSVNETGVGMTLTKIQGKYKIVQVVSVPGTASAVNRVQCPDGYYSKLLAWNALPFGSSACGNNLLPCLELPVSYKGLPQTGRLTYSNPCYFQNGVFYWEIRLACISSIKSYEWKCQ